MVSTGRSVVLLYAEEHVSNVVLLWWYNYIASQCYVTCEYLSVTA